MFRVQAAALAAHQQCEAGRMAAVAAERAALLSELDAQKAAHTEAMTREQLQAQHAERWWGAKQVCTAAPCALSKVKTIQE